MTKGEYIRNARKKAGLTQAQLAKKLNVSQAMIGQYENDKRKPKVDTIVRIADALDADYLIDQCLITKVVPGVSINNGEYVFHGLNPLAEYFQKEEFTPEEIEEIKQFAEFVKSKRDK